VFFLGGSAFAWHQRSAEPALRPAKLISIMNVGLIGWRGMVGSVLVQRMREERDFDSIEPVFFSTSQAGAAAPAIGKHVGPVKNAKELSELAAMDVLISCQGGDY